jgi:hypothetical protein
MALKRNRPLEITPLASPLAPIGIPLSQMSSAAGIEPRGFADVPPASTAESLRSLLINPNKVHEAVVLAELLQPPVSLRRARKIR